MKKLILVLMLLGSFQSHAASGVHQLLVDSDVIREFWAPCGATRLRADRELEEMEEYSKAGFVLVAKIAIPRVKVGDSYYPECQYTFVQKSSLR